MKKSQMKVLAAVIVLFFISTCSTWSNKDWENIKDRNFYFTKFSIFRKSSNRKEAFESMKNFPVREISKIISNKYNINVDVSEFEDFIFFGNTSKIKAGDGFINPWFHWESGEKRRNTVELEYVFQFHDNSRSEIESFNIYLKIDGKKRATYQGYLYESDPALVIIAKSLGYSRLNKNSDDIYVNNTSKEKVDLRPDSDEEKTAEARRKKQITGSEEQIKQQIKDYVKDMPREKKRKFRDDIIKYLYRIIE